MTAVNAPTDEVRLKINFERLKEKADEVNELLKKAREDVERELGTSFVELLSLDERSLHNKVLSLDPNDQEKLSKYIIRNNTPYNELIYKITNLIAECILIEGERLRNLRKLTP